MAYENERDQNPSFATDTGNPYGAGGFGDQGGQQALQQQRAYNALRAAYKRYLNREASDSELESHLAGRYDSATVQRALQTIQGSAERQSVNTQARYDVGEWNGLSPEEQARARAGGGGPSQPGIVAMPPAQPPTREQRDQLTWGNVGRMEGFQVGSDYGGDLKARNSVKNTFGRIASKYPATPDGLKMAMQDPEFKAAFPNARLIDHPTGDKIDFGGVLSDFESGTPVGVVDVGRSFAPDQKEQTAFVWQPEDTSANAYQRTQAAILNRGGAQTGQEGPGYRVPDAVLNAGAPAESDPIAQYLAYLQSLMAPAPPPDETPLF